MMNTRINTIKTDNYKVHRKTDEFSHGGQDSEQPSQEQSNKQDTQDKKEPIVTDLNIDQTRTTHLSTTDIFNGNIISKNKQIYRKLKRAFKKRFEWQTNK